MRVGIVSTYPPRPCGIGTFSRDLRTALLQADETNAVDIVSIVRDEPHHRQQLEVATALQQDVRGDYTMAARVLASRGTDVVLVEHEFGIFGGRAGSFVLTLVERLRQPIVVTLHTVLSEPSVIQAETLRALCHRATLVTVFTETAKRMVVEAQLAPRERVRVVPHGAPTILASYLGAGGEGGPGANAAKSPRPALERLEGRRVLSTFGLISVGKGIEVAIKALPAVIERHPDVLYLVAGQTHPDVIEHEGEQYRLRLERLVRDLDLTDHVHFLDRFFDDAELADLLSSTDLYLTPYRSREQIVSGALTFALVAGCPVVSTPYFYAEDLLASGAGVLVPFGNSAAFAETIIALFDEPAALRRMSAEARRVGGELTWPAVGVQMQEVLVEAVTLGPTRTDQEVASTAFFPRIRPDHLLTLVDDVGIVQHADGIVPNRGSGYCVDDVARLILVAVGLDQGRSDMTYGRMLTVGLSFMRHAWDPDALGMHNLMSYARVWLDEPHGGDHLGRAAWALGEVIAAHPPRPVGGPSLRLLEEMAPALDALQDPRAIALALLGVSRPSPEALPSALVEVRSTLATRLLRCYQGSRTSTWRWFEDALTYDNARLPQALIAAGHRLDDVDMVAAGLEALDWYIDQCAVDSAAVRLVGNRWRRREGQGTAEDEGDEQPIDAAALVEACAEAMVVTSRREYGRSAVQAFEWFFGRNRLGVSVYDFASGGCHDGIGRDALNDNEGAESTLAFLQCLLALDAAGLHSSHP